MPERDAPARERDLRAVRREHLGEVQAEAAEGAGDEGGAAGERRGIRNRGSVRCHVGPS